MIRRYDLRRSDNYMYTGRISYICSGKGTLTVYTGFPVTRATVSFATIPTIHGEEETTSSSSDTVSSSSVSSGSTGYSSESSTSDIIYIAPRIYVSSYTDTGFVVTYEDIPPEVGYIEFSFNAV